MSGLTGEQALQLAEQFLAMGDVADAKARCDEILAAQPDHPGALRLAAAIQFRSGLIAGYSLNLPARTDRAARSSKTLHEAGFPEGVVAPMSAIADPEFGALGCGKSHIAALTDAFIRSRSPDCLVVEDDFEWLEPAHLLVRRLTAMAAAGLRWDVLLLGASEVMPYGQAPVNGLLRVFEASSAVGYVVNRPYLPTLLNCFVEAVAQLERFRDIRPRSAVTGRFAIDVAWKSLQRRDHWYIANPALGHHRAGHSDIEGGFYDYGALNFYALP
jgi:hypothetical protein